MLGSWFRRSFDFQLWGIVGISPCEFFWGCIVNTLPETNVAPENRPLEKEIPIGNHHFQVLR